ncbi:hypothetical protein L6164_020526 [Bauhinia variegata]|uniref:Uncharacterized protein n=1 Tax=Bauhinia variegata TaxID=167791 RepID=A0ACB9N074_BAUVA|nr:hypothetical protein L6164_020526 [Bauhinia variegata]
MLFVNKWKGLARNFLLKANVGVIVLMLTSLYSYFEDRSVERGKEKAYGSILSLISCEAFALVSTSLSRQLELEFEAGMFNFFLGCFLVTVMKMNFKLAPVAAIFCYLLVNFRSSSKCLLKILGREIEHADVESGSNMEANRMFLGSQKTGDIDDGMEKNG